MDSATNNRIRCVEARMGVIEKLIGVSETTKAEDVEKSFIEKIKAWLK